MSIQTAPIHGVFAPNLPSPAVIVNLKGEEFSNAFRMTAFVVDTGAARTVLHAQDAMNKFDISVDALDSSTWSKDSVVQMGSIVATMLCLETEAVLVFEREDGIDEFVFIKILVGDISTKDSPSLLGWDVLRLFNLEIDGKARTIKLTRLPD